jgi:hypothetical protein
VALALELGAQFLGKIKEAVDFFGLLDEVM